MRALRTGTMSHPKSHYAFSSTWWQVAIADLDEIQGLPGHVDISTTQVYTHVSEDMMAGVVARL